MTIPSLPDRRPSSAAAPTSGNAQRYSRPGPTVPCASGPMDAILSPDRAMSVSYISFVCTLISLPPRMTVSAGVLWRLLGGKSEQVWIAWALAACAPMAWSGAIAGQSSGWLLIGLAGFLYSVVKARPAMAALTAIQCVGRLSAARFRRLAPLDIARQ